MLDRSNAHLFVQSLFEQTSIKDVMTRKTVTVYNDWRFSDVVMKFLKERVTHVVVVNRNHTYVGIISQKYIYKAQSPRKIVNTNEFLSDPNMIHDGDSFYDKDVLDSYDLSHVMYKNALTFGTHDTLARTIRVMTDKKIDFVPILNPDKTVCGSLSSHDIMMYLTRLIQLNP